VAEDEAPGGQEGAPEGSVLGKAPEPLEPAERPDPTVPEPPTDRPVALRTYSPQETFLQKPFDQFTPSQLEEARALLLRLRWQVALRRVRRTRSTRRPGGQRPDLRASLRRSLRSGGELTRLSWRAPRRKPRPLVILGDISGSMDRYARLLIQFLYAVRRGRRDVEVFVFGTRLTRITPDLAHRDLDEAMRRVAGHVLDWSGGTRIGAVLHAFNRTWARRVLPHGAVTLIVSDGWDRGEADLLAAELARLQRRSFRLIWLSPLLGLPGYQPLTAGIEAALPYIDDFLPAHNLASLTDLAARLAHLEQRRPVRRSGDRGSKLKGTSFSALNLELSK
jgi:uncharacterized protein with von Willebrand factor type A (vWA) domain